MYDTMRRVTLKSLIITICLSLLAIVNGTFAADYIVVDLGGLPGATVTYAQGINNYGVVVGYSNQGGWYNGFAFRWDGNKGMQNLGVLPGTQNSEARSINNSGQIVGYCHAPGVKAFIWDSTEELQEIVIEGDALAHDINSLGQVVGFVDSGYPFIWDNVNGVREIALPPEYDAVLPYGINDSEEIAGNSYSGTSGGPFILDDENGIRLIDLPGDGYGGRANDINNSGMVVGYFLKPGTPSGGSVERAFLWNGTNSIDLGSLDGNPFGGSYWAYAINNRGKIVGNCGSGWIWDEINGMVDLNDLIAPDSDIHIGQASDINDNGQVVAYGSVGDQTHAVLLTPPTDNDNDEDIDGSDLIDMLESLGETDCSGGCPCDYNNDGNVDTMDLSMFSIAYGRFNRSL